MKDTPVKNRLERVPPYFYFDHKDLKTLKHFINQFGQIEPRRRSANNRDKLTLGAAQQKKLAAAIKRARHLALLPFVGCPKED